MRRGRFLTSVAAIAALGLLATACGSDDSGDSSDTTAASTETTAASTETTAGSTETTAGGADMTCTPMADVAKVGIVYDITGRGDKSFNDAAAKGLDEAAAACGIEFEESTPTGDGDRSQRVDLLAQNGDGLVITVGFLFADTLGVSAPANPDTKFAIIDSAVEQPNVASLVFAEEQGSFLVGAAAALKTQSDHIGFIGGVETELIQKFEAGFTAGAQAVNPDIVVDVAYLTQPPDFTGFNAPDKAKEIAAGMYEAGADIIYSAAGGSGLGAFQAAAEAGAPGDVWAIGVDSDQYELVDAALQPYILTSMLKKVDVAVFETTKAYAEGNFAAGTQVFDLAVGGVGYSTSGGFVDDISAQLDDFAAQIIAGDIVVPTTP